MTRNFSMQFLLLGNGMFFGVKKCPDAWKNGSLVSGRLGKYGGCGKVTYPKSMSFCIKSI